MKRMSWKYMAGLIDGEGCIDMRVTHLAGRTYISPRLRVALTTPGRALLETFKLNFGGSMSHIEKSKKNPVWQDASWWCLENKTLRPFLQNIVNHMWIKKEQARLAIWWIDNVMGKNVGDAVRQVARDEMRAMKLDPQRLSEVAARRITAACAQEGFSIGVRWSHNREYPRCIICGTTERKHRENGACTRCYRKLRALRKTEADAIVQPARAVVVV